jgi:hypothetical protein
MKQFWTEKHKLNDVAHLTGSDLYAINTYMELPLMPDMDVLNIGVGMGKCTRQLKELTNNVYVLDICQEAIDKVKDVIIKGYLTPQSLPKYKFDLIMSHLVSQHINKEELTNHIEYGINALSLQGEMVIQIAVPINRNEVDYSDASAGAGSIKYTIDEVVELINIYGGRLTRLKFYERFLQYNMDWYIFHIKRINMIHIEEPEQ